VVECHLAKVDVEGSNPFSRSNEPGPEASHRAGRGPDGGALGIVPGVLLAGIAGGIAFPILPIVGERFHLKLAFIGVILAANRAVRIVANPVVGAMVDRFGGRRTHLLGLALQVAVMLLFALGVSTGHPGALFLAGRMLHGVGSSCVFVSGQVLALHAGGRAHSGRAAGIVRAAMAVGVPIGLATGGLLSDSIGEVRTFEAAAVAVLAAAAAAFVLVPDLRATSRPVAGLGAIARALADRRLAAIGALNLVATFSAGGMVLTTLVLLVERRHVSIFHLGDESTAGLLMGWMVIAEAIATPAAGRLGDALRAHARIAAAGTVLLVPALVVVAFASNLGPLFLGLALIGVAVAALGPSLLALLSTLVERERRGTAVGLLQLAGDAGGALGPLLGTALFAGDERRAYVFAAIACACFVPLAVWLARQPGLDQR
jgi:ACDE family multidrug resistance protein